MAPIWPLALSISLFVLAALLGIIGEIRRGGVRFSQYLHLSQETRTFIKESASAWLKQNTAGETEEGSGTCAPDNSLLGVRLKGELSQTVEELRYDLMGSRHRKTPKPSIPSREMLDLQKRQWNHESMVGMLFQNTKKRKPFVLREVFQGWSEQFLWDQVATKWPVLEDVVALPRQNEQVDSQTQHVFVTEEQTAGSSLLSFQAPTLERRPGANRVTLVRELLTADFLAQDGEQYRQSGQHYYYSGNYRVFEGIVGESSDANLLSTKKRGGSGSGSGSGSDLSWRSLSFDEFKGSNTSERLADRGINISSGASVTPLLHFLPHAMAMQLRYVEHHTMRTQLTGETDYYLFPSETLPFLHLFPSTHVCRGQSQLPMYEAEMGERERYFAEFSTELKEGKIPVKRVKLTPGDSLYIPPYWAVHAHGGTGLSTVLDVGSPSWEQMALMEAWHMRLPLTDPGLYSRGNNNPEAGVQVSGLERVVAAQVYLVHILSRTRSLRETGLMKSPRDFVRSLYYSRYAQMYPPTSLFMQPYRGTTADKDKDNDRESYCDAAGAGRETVFTCYACGDKDRSKEMDAAVQRLDSRLLTDRAAFIASCVEDSAVPLAAKRVWLENYAERIAGWAMGLSASSDNDMNAHEEGLRFLLSCLDIEDFVVVEEEEEEEGGAIHLGDGIAEEE